MEDKLVEKSLVDLFEYVGYVLRDNLTLLDPDTPVLVLQFSYVAAWIHNGTGKPFFRTLFN